MAKDKLVLQQRQQKQQQQREKQRLENIKRKQLKQQELQQREALQKEEARMQARKTNMDHLFDKMAISARILNGKNLLASYRPAIQFSIATIDKYGVIHYNVKEIDLEQCTIVRVMFKIYSNKVKTFSGIYFDGESPSEYHRHSMTYPDIFLDGKKSSIVIKGPMDKDTKLIYYGDFPCKQLCNRFGATLSRGITPRLKGITMNGCPFSCSGGNEYKMFGKQQAIDIDVGGPASPAKEVTGQHSAREHQIYQMEDEVRNAQSDCDDDDDGEEEDRQTIQINNYNLYQSYKQEQSQQVTAAQHLQREVNHQQDKVLVMMNSWEISCQKHKVMVMKMERKHNTYEILTVIVV